MLLAIPALALLLHQLDAIDPEIMLELIKGLGFITRLLHTVAQPLLERIALIASILPRRALLEPVALKLGRSDDVFLKAFILSTLSSIKCRFVYPILYLLL